MSRHRYSCPVLWQRFYIFSENLLNDLLTTSGFFVQNWYGMLADFSIHQRTDHGPQINLADGNSYNLSTELSSGYSDYKQISYQVLENINKVCFIEFTKTLDMFIAIFLPLYHRSLLWKPQMTVVEKMDWFQLALFVA